jgi:hypothetical protein
VERVQEGGCAVKLGDRVMVKPEVLVKHYDDKRGLIVGDAEKEYGFDWDVMLDGDKFPVSFKESELLLVEVVVLDGARKWIERMCKWYVGDKAIDDYLDNDGEVVRVTFERVKREGA